MMSQLQPTTSSCSSPPSTADPSSVATSPPPLISPPPHPSPYHPQRHSPPPPPPPPPHSHPFRSDPRYRHLPYLSVPLPPMTPCLSYSPPSNPPSPPPTTRESPPPYLFYPLPLRLHLVHVVIVNSTLPKAFSSLIAAFFSDFHTLPFFLSPQLHVSHALPSLTAFLVESISLSLSSFPASVHPEYLP